MARGNESPVRLYAEDDVRLPRRLATYLKERIESLSVTVLQGQLSHDEYKDFTGQIRGLKAALQECESIAEELS